MSIGNGKIKVNREGKRDFEYEGEIDLMNRPCGKGKAGCFSGTWLDGKGHGICKELYFQIIYNLNI